MPNSERQHPRLVVGVDVGGTKITAAEVDSVGRCTGHVTVPTPAAAGPAAVLDAIAETVQKVAGNRQINAIGVGTAGAVDAFRGVIVSATETFPGWVGTDITSGLRARLTDVLLDGGAIRVENDVDAHGIGESILGAGRGAQHALVVAVGTGVGAAVIVGGSPLRGAHHMSGEIGHMPIPDATEDVCTCGRPGHLEAVAAGPAIAGRYARLAGTDTVTAVDVFERARGGDAIALRVIADSARATANAVAGLMTVLDPSVVVVGGGVLGGGDVWWNTFVDAVRATTVDILHDTPLVQAELGADAPLVGATRTFFA
ncbi:ROK family protein [Microbacterium sp. YY-03]|uniref:ROK family protein n=1 Tax=Microbacterium sp. YY-03 TaxID=3421636 RepID=UPI003D166873